MYEPLRTFDALQQAPQYELDIHDLPFPSRVGKREGDFAHMCREILHILQPLTTSDADAVGAMNALFRKGWLEIGPYHLVLRFPK